MSHFLRVGFLGERARELCGDSRRLKEELSKVDLEKHLEVENILESIERGAREIVDFMQSLPSEPLVWTGGGDTDEVISMLENLIESDRRKRA